MQTLLDDNGNPISDKPMGAHAPKSQTFLDDNGNPISNAQVPEDMRKVANSLVYSKMFSKPPADAYQYHDELYDQMKSMGADTNSISNDIKVGLEGSIFGLMDRSKLPDTLKDPSMLDSFVEGLSTMVADLPFYLAGGIAGGVAGSEVPVVGNIAGAAMGSFAAPAAIRKALILGIQKGEIQNFGDLMDRTLDVALAGGEGAVVGLVTHGAGKLALPFTKSATPAVEMTIKRAQQVAAMTVLSDLFQGKIPTAQEFAVNAALFTTMHYTSEAFGMADIAAPKIHAKMQEMYGEKGIHPADIAAEALRASEAEPGVDPIDRLNEMSKVVEQPKEEGEAPITEAPDREEKTPLPDAGLRPAIRNEDEVIEGKDGQTHDEVLKENGIAETDATERVFTDSKGNVYNREEAAAWVRQNEPEVGKQLDQVVGEPTQQLHTEDYNEARKRSTGIKNASVDAQRESMGLPPIKSPMRVMDPENWETAKEEVDSGKIDPLKIATSINENPRSLSPEETNSLNYFRAQLSNQHKDAMYSVERARLADDPQAEERAREHLKDVEDKINIVDEASKRAGTEWGYTGKMRQRMIAEDYSLDRLVQRARVASKTGEVSPELHDRLEKLSKQLEDANKAFEEYKSKAAEREAQQSVERMKNEVKRKERKGELVQVRMELKVEFENQVKSLDKLLAGRMSSNPFRDPDILGILGNMARNRIESGLTRIEDIVDDIHGALTNIGYEVQKRDIQDAISGYGRTVEMSKDAVDVALREAKQQGRLISSLEDAEAKQIPLRTGLQRSPSSDRVRELQQQVRKAMRESGIDVRKSQTPERQWKTSLDVVNTRLKNQITNLTRKIETGEQESKRTGIVYDEEANVLKDERDRLKEIYRQVVGEPGKREMPPETKIKMAVAAAEKRIEEYERRIKEKDLTPSQRRSGMQDTPELKALRERSDALRETLRQMREEAKPKKTPEQIALARFKTYTTKRIAEMEERLASGNFEKTPPRKTVLDPEADALKVKVEKVKDQIDEAMAKKKWEERSPAEKTVHAFSRWRKMMVLSGVYTFGKLGSAAMARMGVTPIEELAGGTLSILPGLSKVAERAPFEGNPNISAEAKALSAAFSKATLDDTWQMLRTGKTSIDQLYGGKGKTSPRTWMDFIGNLHGALKVMPKRDEFFRRLENGTQWALDHNLDIYDPKVKSVLTAGAYEEANRAIFMQDNVMSSAWNKMLNYLHSKGDGGRTLEAVGRTMMPIVKVPSNLAGEILSYNPASLAYQTVKLFSVLMDKDKMGRSAMDNLTMHDFDNVMRGFKKGTVGLALMTIGYACRNKISGFYSPSQKRRPGEAKKGTITIGDTEIPEWLLESPALQTLIMGATVGHVWDHYQQKGESGGLIAGTAFAISEEMKRVPFLNEPARIYQGTSTPEQLGVWSGKLAASLMIPLGVQQVAQWTDKEGKAAEESGNYRKPTNLQEAIEVAIPGAREKVPIQGQSKRPQRHGAFIKGKF